MRWTPLAALFVAGCQDWPRYAHLPDSSDPALLGGSVVPTEVTWVAGETVAVPGLQPQDAERLPPGTGLTWEEELVGAGHLDGEASRGEPDTGCGLTWDHPPSERGAYLGQTHWLSLEPSEVGTLCATVSFEDPSVAADLLLYDLSQCGVPQGPWADSDSGLVLGLEGGSSRTSWRVPVVAGASLGLAVVAAEPDAPDTVFVYRLAVALIERSQDGLDGECPLPPESL